MVLKWQVPLGSPFDWRLKLKFNFLPERPTPALIKGDEWFRVFRFNGELIPVRVKASGTVSRPSLEFATTEAGGRFKERIVEEVSRLHGIFNPSDLHKFMAGDKVLRRLLRKLKGFARAGLMAADPYEGIVKSIIQQQIALRVAENLTANLVEKFGEHVRFLGVKTYCFPRPEKLAEAGVEELKACGLSTRKAEYIKDFSVKVAKGEFNPETLNRLTPSQITEVLTGFRGFGRWTAELVMAAVLGLNVVPADDLGVRKAVSHYFFNGRFRQLKL